MIKKITAIILALTLMVGMGTTVLAEEVALGDACTSNVSVQPKVICSNPNCNSIGLCALVCNKKRVYDTTSTHKYSFGTKTCTIRWYKSSYLGFQCSSCGDLQWVGISPDNEHYCLEIHSSCGDGEVSYCYDNSIMP